LERAPQVADPTLALFVPALEHQLEAGSDPNDQAILNAVLCWLASDFGAPGDLIRQSGEVLDRTTSAQDGMHLRWGMARLTRVREQAEALLHDLPSDAPRRSVLGLHAEWMMTEPIGQDSESCRAWLVEAEQMSDPLLLAHLNYCLGVVETSRGEIAEGQAALARALAMSEHAPALATSLNVTQAITFALIGEKEKAIGIFRSLIDGPVHVTPRVRALAALHLSRTLNTQGLAAAARNAARQARGLVLHLHAPNVAAACSWTEADALLELNMIPEALASYEAAAELYTHMPGHWGSSMMVCFRIRACLIGGQATDDLRVELAPLISDPNPMVASSAKGFMAILDAVDSGPTEATAEALEASLSDLNSEAAARPWWYLHGLTRPALWWAVNRPDRAHAALEEAVEQFRHMHVTPALRGAQQLQERFSGLDKTGEDRSSFLRMAERVLPNR